MRDPLELLQLFAALFTENPVESLLFTFFLLNAPRVISGIWGGLCRIGLAVFGFFSSEPQRRTRVRSELLLLVGDVWPFVGVALVWGTASAVMDSAWTPPAWRLAIERVIPLVEWGLVLFLGVIGVARIRKGIHKERAAERQLSLEIDAELDRMRAREPSKGRATCDEPP